MSSKKEEWLADDPDPSAESELHRREHVEKVRGRWEGLHQALLDPSVVPRWLRRRVHHLRHDSPAAPVRRVAPTISQRAVTEGSTPAGELPHSPDGKVNPPLDAVALSHYPWKLVVQVVPTDVSSSGGIHPLDEKDQPLRWRHFPTQSYLGLRRQQHREAADQRLQLGRTALAQDDYPTALDHFQKGLEFVPHHTDLLAAMADGYFQMGRIQAARAQLELVRERDPHHEQAQRLWQQIQEYEDQQRQARDPRRTIPLHGRNAESATLSKADRALQDATLERAFLQGEKITLSTDISGVGRQEAYPLLPASDAEDQDQRRSSSRKKKHKDKKNKKHHHRKSRRRKDRHGRDGNRSDEDHHECEDDNLLENPSSDEHHRSSRRRRHKRKRRRKERNRARSDSVDSDDVGSLGPDGSVESGDTRDSLSVIRRQADKMR